MEITYSLERHDLLASSKYALRQSLKRTRWISAGCYVVIALSCLYTCFDGRRSTAESLISFVIYSVICVGGSAIVLTLFKSYTVRRMIPKSKLDSILCVHKITLSERELIEVTPVNETHRAWQGIDHIESNDDYIFIFLPNRSYYAIPKRAFNTEHHARQFQDAANYYLTNASKLPVAVPSAGALEMKQQSVESSTEHFDYQGMTPVERVFMQPEPPRADQRL